MTGDIFCSYVQKHLVPHLRKRDIVVMDNLPIHNVSGVREAIESARRHEKIDFNQAFRGELGTNDPAEEWAGELVKAEQFS